MTGATLPEVVAAVDAGEWLFNHEGAVLVETLRQVLDLLQMGEVDDAERLLQVVELALIDPQQGALPT